MTLPTSSQVQFVQPGPEHEGGIRQLLRQALPGSVAISLEREPDYFRSLAREGGIHTGVVALTASQEVVGFGSASIRTRFFNGQAMQLGYLGQLRLAKSFAGRSDILRRGYHFLQQQLFAQGIHGCFASVGVSNRRALRFFESNVRNFPQYTSVGELVTLLLTTHRSQLASRSVQTPNLDPIEINNLVRAYQFAPVWSEEDFRPIKVLREHRSPGGARQIAGIWDQRDFKQVVVRRYSPLLRAARPLLNAMGGCFQKPPLPAIGVPMSLGFVYPFYSPLDEPGAVIPLIRELLDRAKELEIGALVICLDSRDPRVQLLSQTFGHRQFHTRIYCVNWPTGPKLPIQDGRLLFPEGALL